MGNVSPRSEVENIMSGALRKFFGNNADLVSLARWGMFSDASLHSETLGRL